MSKDKTTINFDVEVTSMNLKSGDVILETTEEHDVPVTIIWHYGPGCTELGDRLGDAYAVSMDGPA